jgi:hypothetical protein
VCKLKKALYGLKQVLCVWYTTLTNYLNILSFTLFTANNCIFYDNQGTYITVFVDDLFIIGLFTLGIDTIKAQLAQKFYITDLSLCKFYLGIKVIRDQENQVLKLS